LPGHIISPSRGLIVFAPLFLFSAAGIVRVCAKPDTFHPIYRYLAVLPVVHWFAISLFERWWAGHSYGPRLFSLVIPVLVILLLPAWSTMQRLKPGPRNLLTAVLCLGVAWGLFVQVRGVGNRAVHAWNAQEPNVDLNPGKVWDWKNMQIFADPAAPR
jgi:hypothetical protein